MFPWTKQSPAPQASEEFFTWTPGLKVGIERFDAEHRELVALINQLHKLMVVKRDRVASDQLFDLLLQATRSHFASEETVLTETGYKECEGHTVEHSALIDQLRDLHRQFKAGTISALAMPSFLRKWLVDHIENMDRKYAPFLRSKGIR